MNDDQNLDNKFVGYEYKTVTVPMELDGLWADSLKPFGWTLEGTDAGPTLMGSNTVNMKFKRDRKICNKAELTRLQRQFEACANDIQTMERSKTTSASIAAYVIGLIGAAFMAGSVFAYIGGALLPSIILAVPGFLCWIVPYFVYRKVVQDKTTKLASFIEQKYDELYATCEKANSLLVE